MATVTAFQAKTRFGELLDRVVRGEEIVITRHEKAVARLIPEGGANLERTRQAVVELRAGRSLMAKRRGVAPLADSVYVHGEVKASGAIKSTGDLTVLRAISQAGGVTPTRSGVPSSVAGRLRGARGP